MTVELLSRGLEEWGGAVEEWGGGVMEGVRVRVVVVIRVGAQRQDY